MLAARMQASSEVVAALEASAARELLVVARAATMLENESAIEQTKSLAVKILHRYASAGELQRAALLKHGGLGACLAAARLSRNHGERLWMLCGVLAQMSCTKAEQAELLAESGAAAGAAEELIELYEDALVAGIDADSHRLRTEVSIFLANLASGDGGDAKDAIQAAGGEEAVDEAITGGTGLAENREPAEIVRVVEKQPHHGALLAGACVELRTYIDAGLGRTTVALASQASAASELIDAGVVRAVAAGLRRHAHSDAVASAALSLLAALCRWQPRAALLLRSAHAIEPCLDILRRALHGARPAATLAAVDLLHALAVDQATMPAELPLTSMLLDVAEAAPLLLRAAKDHSSSPEDAPAPDTAGGGGSGGGGGGGGKNKNSAALLTVRHAHQATSWLVAKFPSDPSWAVVLKDEAGGNAFQLRAALATPLGPDCSILSAESIARAMHAGPLHAVLVRDGCAELRKQVVRRHRTLVTQRFVGLQLVDVLLSTVAELGKGKAYGSSPSGGAAEPAAEPAAAAPLAVAADAAIGAVLALCASLSNDDAGLDHLKSRGALPALLPFLRASKPPPSVRQQEEDEKAPIGNERPLRL